MVLWILFGLAVMMGMAVIGLSLVYRNPRIPHRKTPAAAGIGFEEVRFPTKNDCTLYGWWIPAVARIRGSSASQAGEMTTTGDATSPAQANSVSFIDQATRTAPTLILVHGWGRNVQRVLDYIVNLHPRGFNLLAFDSRNHGSSDRDRFSSMLKFAEDIVAAVDFVVTKPGVDPGRIGVIGLSIGGAASIYAAAHDSRIKTVVTVGAFAHPVEVMRPEFTKRHIPAPILRLLFKYFEWRIGATFDAIAPQNQIARAGARFLIIHGNQDVVVPLQEAEKLEEAANPSSTQLWILPGKGHSDCHTQEGFWERIDRFLQEPLA